MYSIVSVSKTFNPALWKPPGNKVVGVISCEWDT